ncbi:uncharacterized protein TNCV_3427001 [Trichonephila clavipes]|nr:uncharacterized protein TNCV_3427001 [Trichonephila clavipes]
MASAVLADPARALQGTNRWSGQVMEESENDVGNLEQLLLYADEHYLAEKLPLADHLGKVLHGVEEYHQRNVGPLRFHASQLKWTGYHRLWPPRPLHQLCGQCDVEQCGGNCTAHQGASTPVHGYHLSPKQTGSSDVDDTRAGIPPLLTTTPHLREYVSALDRFNVHRCPTRRVFSGTGFELATSQATIRYLYHSATAATRMR